MYYYIRMYYYIIFIKLENICLCVFPNLVIYLYDSSNMYVCTALYVQ